jgi:hypothetical protein
MSTYEPANPANFTTTHNQIGTNISIGFARIRWLRYIL